MTLRNLLLLCRERDIQLAADLDTRIVRWTAPPGRMTADVLDAMRTHKADLMLLACLVELGADIPESFNLERQQ